MPFPWFSIAKYSGVVLSCSSLGAGACLLTHEKTEEIKHQEELPEEIKKQLVEDSKTKASITKDTLDAVIGKITFANKKNVVYAKVVDCFIGEQKRLIAARKHNSERFSWASDRQDETPRYQKCSKDNPIPTS